MAKEAKKASEDAAFNQEVGQEDDDNFVVDFGDVEALKFEAIPKGWYTGKIVSMDYKRSQSSGKPMWELKIAIDEGEYKNRQFWYYASFSEGALPGTKVLISNIAPQLLESPLNPKKAADDQVLVGLPVRFQLEVEKTKEWGVRNRVKRIEAAEAGNAFLGG